MQLENLEKAVELNKALIQIDTKIDYVQRSLYVCVGLSDHLAVKSNVLKYGQETIHETVKLLFLENLQREKDEILKEIEEIK